MAILNSEKGILKEGYLFKQSRHVWKLWKARYFVLQTNGLVYYKEKSDLECAGRPLGVLTFRDMSMHIEEVGEKKRKYCLKIHSEGKNYLLCCFSEEERNGWMTAILTAVTSYLLAVRDGASEVEMHGLAGEPLPRSISCEALSSLSLKGLAHTRNRLGFGSSGDLDRISKHANPSTSTRPRSQVLAPLSKRKLKAFSMWETTKWRDSYINFSEM